MCPTEATFEETAESARLAALRALRLLDTPREERFDRLTRLAARLLRVPIATVSLVEDTRQWFKSAVGLTGTETPRSQSFCTYALRRPDRTFIVPDARLDPRFCDNPLVTGEPGIRFYAGHPLRAPGGEPVGALCVIDRVPRDFTESELQTLQELTSLVERELWTTDVEETLRDLAASERELVAAKAKFEAFVERSPCIVYMKDAEGRMLYMNEHGRQLFKSPSGGSVIGLRDDEFLAPHVAREVMENDRSVFRSGKACEEVEHVPTADGAHSHWRSWKFPFAAADGSLILGGVSVDVTEQYQAEHALKQISATQQAILDGANCAIVATDATGIITSMNRTAEKWLGYTERDLVGRETPAIFNDMEDVAAKESQLSATIGRPVHGPLDWIETRCALSGQAHDEDERTFIRRDGSRFPVNLSLTVLRDAAGRAIGTMGVARDISVQRAAEQAQREASAEAERARVAAEAANVAKSRFLANMSHEVRTPLHGILGVIGMLRETKLEAAQDSLARTVQQSAEGLLSVVNSILDFSKIESGRLELLREPFSPRRLIEEIVRLHEPRAAEKGVSLAVAVATDVPELVLGDGGRVQQILTNFVSNAVKFSTRGTVRIEAAPDGERRLRFAVTDEGIGFAPEAGDRIWQPFIQADTSTTRRFGGTGLGLPIARQLAELMGGSTGAFSEPGQGATFWFTVPCERSEQCSIAVPAAAFPSNTAHGLRVLLAEDNSVNRLTAVHYLEQLGCAVETASDGRAAVETWARGARVFDLVLMDCQMPELDGYEATAEIRRLERAGPTGRRPTRIVALTANAIDGERERCLASGMDDFLSKPFRPEQLAEVVCRAAPAPPSRPPEAPTLARKAVAELRRLEGGKLLGQILEALRIEAPETLRELGDALARHNPDGIRRAAHRLKGSAATLGASRLQQLSADLETLGRRGDLSQAGAVLGELTAEVHRVLLALEKEAARPAAA